MAERSTRVRPSQISAIKPDDLQATNSPANGQTATYDSTSQNFTWQNVTVGLFEIDLDGGVMPIVGSNQDNQFELDASDNLMPKI